MESRKQKDSGHTLSIHARPDILWKSSQPLLGAIDIELTERCNNNCVHCCINLPEHDTAACAKEMTTEHCKDLIRQAAELGALTVRMTGGEPLLRDDFVDIYLYARRLGMKVMIFTNGRLITPSMADLFARVPPLEAIELTVYGMRKATYESVTGKKGSFEEFQSGLKNLLDRNIPVYVKGTLLPANRHEINDFIAWAQSLPRMDDLASFVMFLELRHRRDSERKNKRIAKMRLSPEEGLKVLTMQPELYRKEMKKFFDHFMMKPTDLVFTCNAANRVCIDAYGNIQYCLALRHPDTVLDSRRYSLEYAVKEFFPKLRGMRSRNADFLSRCARCFLRGFCDQCPAKSWNESGTLDQPADYWCRIAHEQARYLNIIGNGENAWEVKNWRDRIKRMAE
ncbi:MAG: radical SAM protein [Deltaproteobacteria bacterium]|nr:radical SAM protein [Deltaproteobacteria bacterium]